jgi:hypothetical protein
VNHSPRRSDFQCFSSKEKSSDCTSLFLTTSSAKPQAATDNQQTKMQNYCKTIGALAAASALVAGNAQAGTAPMTTVQSAPTAETSGINYEMHAGYTNEYLFRGTSLGLGLVEAGADVSGEAFGLGLSAGVWYANYDADLLGNVGGFNAGNSNVNEIDLYAEVSKDLGFLTAAVGYIYYYNDLDDANAVTNGVQQGTNGPLDALDTQEVYFSLGRDLGFATASLTYFWDVVLGNDGYSEFALSRSFELTSCLALNASTNVGYLVERGRATAWTTKVGIDWAFAERAKLSPFAALSVSLSDFENSAYQGNANEFVAGSMISVSF